MSVRIINDNIGRLFAIFFVTPLLIVAATVVHDCTPAVAIGLYSFAVILFFYELFWVCIRQKYEVAYISYHTPIEVPDTKNKSAEV